MKLENLEILDVVPVPLTGDSTTRLRTLEEAIRNFENDGETEAYFIKVRPNAKSLSRASQAPAGATATSSRFQDENTTKCNDQAGREPCREYHDSENIYLQDGKLNAPFLLRSAEMLVESGDMALARNIYKAIVQSGERPAVGLVGIARCYEIEGKFDEARRSYEEAIAYHPLAETYQALIALLIRQRNDALAVETIDRILHHKDLAPAIRFELCKTAGNCWSRMDNLREAERHYKKALEIRPDADEIRTNLGAIYLQSGKTSDAERHFQDAIASNPDNVQALTGLGSCALSENNSFAAHAWFARSLQLDIQNPTAIFHLVKCAYAIKNYTVAAQILEKYVQVAPVNISLLYSLAGLQFHSKQFAPARATCERIQQLSPGHSGSQNLLKKLLNPIAKQEPGW